MAGTGTEVGATRTDGWAGAVEGVDGATQNTAAHKAASTAATTNSRCQAAASSIVQLLNMPAFNAATSWRSIFR
jgi:hypothetical protein